jgi:hypothetical protein
MERAGVAEVSGTHSMQAAVAVVQGVAAWTADAKAQRVRERMARMGRWYWKSQPPGIQNKKDAQRG